MDPVQSKIGVKIIEEVTKFKYLVLLTAQQVVNTNRVIGCMNDFVWNSTPKESAIRPMLTYGREDRSETSKTKRQTTERRLLCWGELNSKYGGVEYILVVRLYRTSRILV